MTKAKILIGFKNLPTPLEIAIIKRQNRYYLFVFRALLYAKDGINFVRNANIENLRELMNEFGWLFKSQVELISAFPMISFVVVPAGA